MTGHPKNKNKPAIVKKQISEKKKNYNYLILAAILVITSIIYSNSIHNSILNFDDNEYFLNYHEVTHLSWHSIKEYFSKYYVIMYQPLPILTFAINYYLTQLDTAPLHSLNLIFHLLNIILVYLFIYKLSGKSVVALIASALFAVHPMNVEAVSWISARSSSMYTFFYILAIIFYIDYVKKQQSKYIIFAGGAFIFSLFSKAQAVTLPVVLLLLDFYFLRKDYKKALLEKIPFFILSIIFGVITILDKGTITNLTKGMMISYTYPEAFFLACYSFLFYLYKLILPIDLCAIHVYPPKVNGYLPLIYYLSPVILLLLGFVIYKLSLKRKYIWFGVLLFLITILINIQLIPSRLFIVSERYGYFPYIGLLFIAGQFYYEIIQKKIKVSTGVRQLLVAFLIINMLVYLIVTRDRNTVWKDNISFMTDVINKNPAVPYLSRAYGTRANAYQAENNLKAALADFTMAIKVRPDDDISYYNRALLNIKLKKYNDAIKDLDKSISLVPGIGLMYSNRAVAKYYLQDNKGALEDCNTAIKLKPDLIEVYNIRGALRFIFKDYKGSEDDFNTAIRLKPDYSESYRNRGNLFLNLKQMDKACKDFSAAADLGDAAASELLKQYCNK